MSLTTLNGYLMVGTIFFAALPQQPNCPHWLTVASYSGAAICGALTIAVGHYMKDAR